MRLPVIIALAIVLAVTGCATGPQPAPEPPACQSPGDEETDGGVGGTGVVFATPNDDCPAAGSE